MSRVLVWFSCGEASACALKLAVTKYGNGVIPIYCDVAATEDPDNIRFRADVERWVGVPIQTIKSDKFETIDEVFEKTRYMAGLKGARCTTEMKKIPRLRIQEADDIHIFGFTSNEAGRILDFENKNPDMILEWILRDNGVTKIACRKMVSSAGIATPKRYLQGFKNNNCECCVKATGVPYWVLSRRHNPETFQRRAKQSREIGARLMRYNGKRIFLDELPPDEEIIYRKKKGTLIAKATENISCGPECGQI